ncbi:MAG: hypothetical protein ABS35_15265, partial [Kaistia sp. SCN 65-12]
MEHGFFHPDRGYWQAIGDVSEDVLAAYPEGTIEVPLKPGADYEWQNGAWVDAPLPPAIPDRVSSRQFKMQLAISGLKAPVEAWIAAQDELTQIAYEYSGEFVRGEPMMQAGFAALGFTPEQGDAFFTAAAAL